MSVPVLSSWSLTEKIHANTEHITLYVKLLTI
jgi:hypothetical protein